MARVRMVGVGESTNYILGSMGIFYDSHMEARLKELNPHIENINLPDPGQFILVPEDKFEMVADIDRSFFERQRFAGSLNLIRSHLMHFKTSISLNRRRHLQFAKVDQIDGFQGAGIYFFSEVGGLDQLRAPGLSTSKIVVVHEVDTAQPDNSTDRLYKEIWPTVLSCGGLALGFFATTVSVPIAPTNGGIATAALAVGTFASGIQCVAGGARLLGELSGYGEKIDVLDSNEFYLWTSLALDSLALMGGTVAMSTGLRSLVMARKSAGSWKNLWKGSISRQGRKDIVREISEFNLGPMSNKVFKSLNRNGTIPKRFQITEFSNFTRQQLLSSLSASLDFVGSGYSGVARKSGKQLAITIFEIK